MELRSHNHAGRVGLQADGVDPAAAGQGRDRVVLIVRPEFDAVAVPVVDRDAIGSPGRCS